MSDVTAVIPTFNQRVLLEEVLRDLNRQTHAVKQILVVDDGSTDGSAGVAESAGARVLRMGGNSGFARAVNRGIREADTALIAVVNNDVKLAETWLAELVAAVQSSGAWFAPGKIFRWGSSDVLDGAFDALARSACACRCGAGRNDSETWSTASEIAFAPFTAAVFRADLFREVGTLDERFESYLEDVDFGLRCALKGRRGRYEPRAEAWHRGSATLGNWSAKKTQLMSRNQLLLVAKHYPPGWWLHLGWPVFIGQLLWGAVAARNKCGRAWWKGKMDGFRLWGSIRNEAKTSSALLPVLREQEHQIHEIQRSTGFDRYWRWYFALT